MNPSFEKITPDHPKYYEIDVFRAMNNIKSFRHIWRTEFSSGFASVQHSIINQYLSDIRKKIGKILPNATVFSRNTTVWGEVYICLKSSKANAMFIFYADSGAFDP
jgi:hypothetical protein